MDQLDGNTALLTAATPTVRHHVHGNSAISRAQVVPTELTLEAVTPAPARITETEVVLNTAIAVPAWPTTRRWTRSTGVVLAAIRRILTPTADHIERPKHYPPRSNFLEYSCTEREMHRL